MTLLDLMQISSSAKFDFEEVSRVIERDVSLSYMLFRFINNPVVNKRNEITSMSHALTYMGEIEIKKFIALVALGQFSRR